jgi:glycosyltransferase involved in cell wall biosynthesis
MPRKRVTLVALVAGGHGGVPRYAQSLVRGLSEVASEFQDLELSVLTTERGARALGGLGLDVRTVPLRSPAFNRGAVRIVTEQLATRTAEGELLHFFDLTGPVLAPRRPFVATAHDLSLRRGYGRFTQFHKRKLIPWAARHARALVAISEFTRRELVEELDVPAGKITVIHSGPGLLDAAGSEATLEPPEGPYLLFVGNLTESKNLPLAVAAFSDAPEGVQLLLVGRPLERYGEIVEAIEHSPRRADIRVIHDATDADIDGLYRRAAGLLLPSRYEGFGLTALEAMARGCPVLASDIPALREVSGEGAELLPPGDIDAWANAMSRLLTDSAHRAQLIARGTETVSRYSWQATARALGALLRTVND